MNRQIVYPGAIPLDTDILSIQQNAMVSDGYLAQALLGTNTVVWGLSCGPTSPASMSVIVGPGAISESTDIDPSAFGSLGTNTAPLMKVGINTTGTTIALTAPSSAGQSINYLIEAQFLEQDGTPVVLPYYNASNPAQPYTGPSNSGASQNTVRAQTVSLQLKAGAAANTGTQTTPAVDSGWVGLYVITVAYGATTVMSANISIYPGAPFLSVGGKLLATRVFNTAGTSTYTSTAGTNRIRWRAVGGGGSGGGVPAAGSSDGLAASGGTGGAYCEGEATSGFSGATLTVGAGGAAPTAGANNGNTGGTTSLGSLFSCPGGTGGVNGSNSTSGSVPNVTPSGANTAAPTGSGGTFYVASPGGGSGFGNVVDLSSLYIRSGEGGATPWGPGGQSAGQNSNGNAGVSPGSGGSGACAANSGGTAYAGGAGATGLILIEEWSA